jgi:hypothetical protein
MGKWEENIYIWQTETFFFGNSTQIPRGGNLIFSKKPKAKETLFACNKVRDSQQWRLGT